MDSDQPSEPSYEEASYRNFNWIRHLGYGIEFDLVSAQVWRAEHMSGKIFYSHPSNKLYPWYILKLHGSINWFRYLYPETIPGEPDLLPIKNVDSESLILSESRPNSLNGWYIDPVIITPALYKEKQFQQTVFRRILTLWNKARDALSNCKKLVVIGYSFPPTDFLTMQLFLESFSSNQLDGLIVVNSNTSVVQKVKELCHHNKPVIVCKDLIEYLSYVS